MDGRGFLMRFLQENTAASSKPASETPERTRSKESETRKADTEEVIVLDEDLGEEENGLSFFQHVELSDEQIEQELRKSGNVESIEIDTDEEEDDDEESLEAFKSLLFNNDSSFPADDVPMASSLVSTPPRTPTNNKKRLVPLSARQSPQSPQKRQKKNPNSIVTEDDEDEWITEKKMTNVLFGAEKGSTGMSEEEKQRMIVSSLRLALDPNNSDRPSSENKVCFVADNEGLSNLLQHISCTPSSDPFSWIVLYQFNSTSFRKNPLFVCFSFLFFFPFDWSLTRSDDLCAE